MAKPDSALLTRKRETPLQWEVLLVIVLILSLVLGRVLSPVFLTGANISNVLADPTERSICRIRITTVIPAVSKLMIDTLSKTSRRFCRFRNCGFASPVPTINRISTTNSVISRLFARLATKPPDELTGRLGSGG